MSFPLLESSGSVQEARLKQHGLRFPCSILEIATATLRSRVAAFRVAFIHLTHSHLAIGVMVFQSIWTVLGAAVRASARSCGTSGSGQSATGKSVMSAEASGAPLSRNWVLESRFSQWPDSPSGSTTVEYV